MFSNFIFLDQFLFELSCKNTHTYTHIDTDTHTHTSTPTHTHKHTHSHAHTHTHRESNEYSIVAFSKKATIITRKRFSEKTNSCVYK